MSPVDMRVGWCPGALRPMPSGDGLVVRVKPRGGTLAPEIAAGIAEAAARHGNGAIDLTGRANLQIRGVEDGSLAGLTRSLAALGLLDTDAGAEARRNVVASSLAGIDPSAVFDIRPAVAALEDRLVADRGLANLPGKFGFALSDGGTLPLDGVPADVRFEAMRRGDAMDGFSVRLDGDLGCASRCDVDATVDAAVRLASVFIAARERDPALRRMRDLVAQVGAVAVMTEAGLTAEATPAVARGRMAAIVGLRVLAAGLPRAEPATAQPCRGTKADGEFVSEPSHVLGVAAAFGRLDAAGLDALARGALRIGAREIRLTPWRAVLVPGLAISEAQRLASDCAAAGLIVDPGDPRLRVAACVGAPGCRRGTTAVLDHAGRWAALLGPGDAADGIALHVSGCAKGCAHPGPAPLTLVAEEGRYGLVADGSAADVASAVKLDADEVRRLLRTAMGWDRLP